jgi:hypothetical protein
LKQHNKKKRVAKKCKNTQVISNDPNRPSDVIWAHKPGERSLAARSCGH